jgi:alpha-tubulin suppressor-like RCC1 family protein
MGQAGRVDEVVAEPLSIDLTDVESIAARGSLSCAARTNQEVWCWGETSLDAQQSAPLRMNEGQPARRVLGVLNGGCGQKDDGSVWCLGENTFGSLSPVADEWLELQEVPSWGRPAQLKGAQWATLENSMQMVACPPSGDGPPSCHNHTCALFQNGLVSCAGNNRWGQVGDNEASEIRQPYMNFIRTVRQLAVGGYHTCVVDLARDVWCWGYNGSGQLGQPLETQSNGVPTKIPNLSGVEEIAAGAHHTCALVGQDDVKCWGMNDYGQIGEGDASHVPRSVERLLVGHAPVFMSEPPAGLAQVNQWYTYNFTATDQDADILTFEVGCSHVDPDRPIEQDHSLNQLKFRSASSGQVTCSLMAIDSTQRVGRQMFVVSVRQ